MEVNSGEDDLMIASPAPSGWGRLREFQGPVRLQTLRPIPRAEREPIPKGTKFVAGARVGKAVWHAGLAGLVQEYGPSEDAPATDRPEDVEIQLRLLELKRQWVAQRNEDAKQFQEEDLQSIERHLAELEGLIGGFLSNHTQGAVAPDDRDLGKRLQKWWNQLAEGEVPEELDREVFEKDPGKALGLIHYVELVSSLRSQSQRGLRWALPAARVIADRQEAQLRVLMLEAEGKTAEAADYQKRLDEDTLEAADASDLGASELLDALRIAVSLLASMNPEDLIRGARQLDHTRKAGSAKKYARGIQAAVDHVYRPGMTEPECWEGFLVLVGKDVSEEDLDNGWYVLEEVEEGRYEFMIDSADDKYRITVRDTETRDKRKLRKSSFYRYFARARDAARKTASVR